MPHTKQYLTLFRIFVVVANEAAHHLKLKPKFFRNIVLCSIYAFFLGFRASHDTISFGVHLPFSYFLLSGLLAIRITTSMSQLFSRPKIFTDTLVMANQKLIFPITFPTFILVLGTISFLTMLLDTLTIAFVSWLFIQFPASKIITVDCLLGFSINFMAYFGLGMLISVGIKNGHYRNFVFQSIALISTLFGGVFYPVEQFPKQVELFSKFIPLSYLIKSIRSSMADLATGSLFVPFLFSFAILLIGFFYMASNAEKSIEQDGKTIYKIV